MGVERFSLVVHDWGVVGLATAQRLRERLDRLVVIAGVPLLPGYEWHRWARIWRTPFVGEMFMGLTTKWGFKQSPRRRTHPGRCPELIDGVWEHFDHGTQRAILKLYRSADPEVLEGAGREPGCIECPALVITPASDPYIGPSSARTTPRRWAMPSSATVERAGHWPWLDRPELIDDVASFLAG